MKKRIFSLLLVIVASIGMKAEIVEHVQIGDLYYNLDPDYQTAEVTYQESYSSNNYSGLTTITIPTSVEHESVMYSVVSIGDRSFWNCYYLTNITIPNTVTRIGWGAFRYCSLMNLEIPNSVTVIENYAFFGCQDLTSIEIPGSVVSIGGEAFSYCTGLTSVTISNGVITIGEKAFSMCTNLTDIEIPNSVTSIGKGVFSTCPLLTNISVDSDNTIYDSRDNCNAIIETETNTLIAGCQNSIIPKSVICIGDEAFYDCKNLTSVTIPNGVNRIGEKAFYNCFNLISIDIPNTVTSIGYEAFCYCSNLTNIICKAVTPPTCESEVFMGVNKSIPLYVPEESVDLYKAADVWNEFENIIGIKVHEDDYNINYYDKIGEIFYDEVVTLHVPEAPIIDGFTFLKWQVVAGDLEDGINIQAVYTADSPTLAPDVYTNPSNSTQKLIRQGNVYILTDTHTYTLTGQIIE